jgi:VWFA-related protein
MGSKHSSAAANAIGILVVAFLPLLVFAQAPASPLSPPLRYQAPQAVPALREGQPQALQNPAGRVSAVPSPSQQVQQAPVIREESRLALVDVTVKDASGRVMDGLTAKDFQLTDDGVAQSISYFGRYEMPLAVALVVDLSASIAPFITPLRYATQTALQTLKANDEVALFTFSTSVQRVVDFTHDKQSVASEIPSFVTGGKTNINGAIFDAAVYLERTAPSARRVIILISDDVGTTGGGVSAEQAENEVLKAGAGVFNLKVPGENPPEAKILAHFILNVPKLANETGGEVFDMQKQGSLYLAFEALLDRLKTRYTLGYSPQGVAEEEGRFHSLSVRLVPSHGTTEHDYRILAPRGYYPQLLQ